MRRVHRNGPITPRLTSLTACVWRHPCVCRKLRPFDLMTESPNVSGDDCSVMLVPDPVRVGRLTSSASFSGTIRVIAAAFQLDGARRWLAGAGLRHSLHKDDGFWQCRQIWSLPVSFACHQFACHPAGLLLRRAQPCAAQPSRPSFSVSPRSVRVLPSVVQPGLCRNLA